MSQISKKNEGMFKKNSISPKEEIIAKKFEILAYGYYCGSHELLSNQSWYPHNI